MKSYRQLTLDERYQIQAMFALGYLRIDIARKLNRNRSTIGREIRRNGGKSPTTAGKLYSAKSAQAQYGQRRIAKGEASWKISGILKDLVETKLRLGWSPEQISGR